MLPQEYMMKQMKIRDCAKRQECWTEVEMVERLMLCYPRYERAVWVVDAMLEKAYTKRKDLRLLLKQGKVGKAEYDALLKDINRQIKAADYKRYLCFTTYIARHFEGQEDELVKVMGTHGFPLLSERYVQHPAKLIYNDILDFLFV